MDNSYLFENLNIMNSGEKYIAHMGKYPVIKLSLQKHCTKFIYLVQCFFVKQKLKNTLSLTCF
ncbi:hypothetical protein DIC82_11655 [Clostridium beijerinckii]|nr:hypothetical protein DIC82_11655 [Clostridium beijerinckii]